MSLRKLVVRELRKGDLVQLTDEGWAIKLSKTRMATVMRDYTGRSGQVYVRFDGHLGATHIHESFLEVIKPRLPLGGGP